MIDPADALMIVTGLMIIIAYLELSDPR